MISREEVCRFGFISKLRGISGELEIQFTDDVFDRGDADYIVFELDGILVPFFWEEYKFKNNEVAIFKFAGIDDEKQAKKYVGTRVFYPLSALPKEGGTASLKSWKALIGFKVVDSKGRNIGEVDNVDDSTQNILLYLKREKDGTDFLLPFHEDLLLDVDFKERKLMMEIPDGLELI